ncbi:MAG: Sip1-related alpha-galactosidase [Eubacteriales bacterium]|nr:Sip1-related alpha-galactosidase [Eubacteriales bacterium]
MDQAIVRAQVSVNRQKAKTAQLPLLSREEKERSTLWNFGEEGVAATLSVGQSENCLTGYGSCRLEVHPFRETDGLAFERPLVWALELKNRPVRMTAQYLHRDWWTRPCFVKKWEELPERTQCVYLDYGDRFGCLLLLAGNSFKTMARGGAEGLLTLETTAYLAGAVSVEEPLFVLAEGQTPKEAVETACRAAARETGVLLREQKELPELFEYFGWCSWDAFYTEISEEKVRQKAQELKDKQIPARWLLLDDGWLSVRENRLYELGPEKEKFPEGFRKMTADLKRDGQFRWIGVWHSLGGYWGGIEPGSRAALSEEGHLYRTRTGRLLPAPRAEEGYGFYRDWYEDLRSQGIDFVKVDGQSAIKNHYADDTAVCRAARETHRALEGAAGAYMGGRLINCMGMAMENILGRQGSAVSRNSDDFVPDNPEGFAEHLLQNAYNAPYHSAFYVCDWDMFWSNHPDAKKHAVLRAVSGGPVYVSDRIGETNAGTILPLLLSDGRILRMERAALPSADSLFADPAKEGLLKLTNVAGCGLSAEGKRGGAVAVYNLTGAAGAGQLSAADIPDLPEGEYLCVDALEHRVLGLTEKGGEGFPLSLEAEGFALYLFVPVLEQTAVLGLADKYIGFAALERLTFLRDGFLAVLRDGGDFSFCTRQRVAQLWADGEEVSGRLTEKDGIYTLPVAPGGQRVVQVRWKE